MGENTAGSEVVALTQLHNLLNVPFIDRSDDTQDLIHDLNGISLKDVNLTQRELLNLCRLSINYIEWLAILFRLMEDYSITSNYISLHVHDSIEFRVNKKLHKAFTIQTWLQINDDNEITIDADCFCLLKISNFLRLEVEQNKLVVVLTDEINKEHKATFDSFNFEYDTPYHVVLTHSGISSHHGSKFDLYIDSEFIQSVSINCDTHSVPNSTEEIEVVLCNDGSVKSKIIDFVNLMIINDVQPLEWILLSYHLSPEYSGSYRDNDLTEALSYKSKNIFELKLKELYMHSTLSKHRNGGSEDYKFEDFSRQELLKFEQIHSVLLKSGKLNLAQESIVLQFNSKHSFTKKGKLVVPYDENEYAQITNVPSLWKSLAIKSAFYSIGGITVAFKFIESASSTEHLCLSINFLFEVISKDWRDLKEFEMRNGYDLLATLLKTKKQLVDLKVLDLILKFIGYDYNSPIDSILINPFAYRSLILDFDIWKLEGENNSIANKETFKFLLFQFTVFFQESKYSLYNINKLVKMRIIKRFIQAMKFESFGRVMLPAVHSSLLILIKANPSSEIMKSLSLYIVYALNKDKLISFTTQEQEPLQRLCGLCALDVLVSYICDSSLVNTSLASASGSSGVNVDLFYRKLAKTISVRWVLLLLDDPNPKVVKLALRLLIRMLSIAGLKYYNNFMNHYGLDILTNLLTHWWDDNEIIVILFSGAFGISQIPDLGSDLSHFAGRLSKRGSRLTIVMPDFLYLINNLLLHGIEALQDLYDREDKKLDSYEYDEIAFNLASSLNSFIDCVEITHEKVPSLAVFYSKDVKWISGYLHIISKLELLQPDVATSEVLSTKTTLIDKFSNFIIELLFKESVGLTTFEQFNSKFSDKQVEMVIMKYLIYPAVVNHLINFKDMLPELLNSQDWLKHNILKFVESFGDAAAKIQYEGDLYLNFTKVLGIIFEILQLKKSEADSLQKLRRLAVNSFVREYQGLDDVAYLTRLTKDLLFRQELFFHTSSMKPLLLAEIIGDIYRTCEKFQDVELQSMSVNALRMILLYRQDDLDRVADLISTKDKSVVREFFDQLLSSSDQDVIERMKDPSLLKIFEQNIPELSATNSAKELASINNSIQVIKEPDSVASFQDDNCRWKITVTSAESTKFFRHIQDYDDNLQFYISVYNKMRQESTRLLFGELLLNMKWVVDSIECSNRMRRRIVPEPSMTLFRDFMVEQQPLPVKDDSSKKDTKKQSIMSSLTLSSSIASIDLEESFEMIEDPLESEAIQEDKNRKVLRSLYVGDTIVDLWNISQILGLESVESILILGNSHLYIVENYFHSSSGEIMDINDAPESERDPYMQLIVGPKHKPQRDNRNKTTKTWGLEKLTSVSKRQFLLRDVALEFFFNDGSSFLVTCMNQKIRDKIYSRLSHLATWKGVDPDLSQALKLSTSSLLNGNGAPKIFGFNFSNAFANHSINSLTTTKKWQRGEISNFYYLIIINTLAGRTFNDLTQYPVFPWVIADYTSEELDLHDPKVYRDLTKPMGGQGSQREQTFIERYEALASLNDPDAPPFHYGTHYSSAMIVTHFLIRLEPYVQSYLLLQGGKFDHADRLFYSIAKAWNSAAHENTTDVRELIPEFFYLPEFLENSNGFDLGSLQDGETIGDVILPPWAKGDPKIFIQKNREALESPYVSSHLHEWIDLVFGYKQSGRAAIESTNVFHHLSYNGAIDLDKIEDQIERRAITGIIHNFGQTPLQVFNKPHPPREDLKYPKLDVGSISSKPVSILEAKCKFKVNTIELSSKGQIWKGRPSIFSNEDNVCVRSSDSIGSLFINGKIYENLHDSQINVLVPFGQKMFLSGANDGTIHVWKYVIRFANNGNGNVTVGRRETMSTFLELKHDALEFQAILRGHLAAIVDIKIARSFNSASSLDKDGVILLWDLVRLSLVREIPTESIGGTVTHIAIANDTGNIIISSSDKLTILTINGEIIYSGDLIPDGDDKIEVNSIDFAQSNWTLPKHGSTLFHEYWQKSRVFVVGSVDKVSIFELIAQDGVWKLNKMASFEIEQDEGNGGRKITAVRLMLSTELDQFGRKTGKGTLLCGDDTGKVILWQ